MEDAVVMMAVYHVGQDSWWLTDRPEETIRHWAEKWNDVICFFVNISQDI